MKSTANQTTTNKWLNVPIGLLPFFGPPLISKYTKTFLVVILVVSGFVHWL